MLEPESSSGIDATHPRPADAPPTHFARSVPRRPVSLAIISVIALVFYGGCYVAAITLLLSGAGGMTVGRLFVEPPEQDGGIPWPGWDTIGQKLRGELPPATLNDLSTLEPHLQADYWWSKLTMLGSLLVGPIMIVGWLGVFMGRTWGRTLLYVYVAGWLANKVVYLMIAGAKGVFMFSVAVMMTVLLVSLLRLRSWSAWIEHASDEGDRFARSVSSFRQESS